MNIYRQYNCEYLYLQYELINSLHDMKTWTSKQLFNEYSKYFKESYDL